MKNLLPQTNKNTSGFTLIELLVVIAIIAVLAVMGFAAFGGLTGRGNDDRRLADMKAFSDAMEVKKANSAVYLTVAATDFATGTFPSEPTTRVEKYCYDDGTTAIANPATWVDPTICPAGWENVSGSAPTVGATATFFKFCTLNQAKNAVICQGSRQ